MNELNNCIMESKEIFDEYDKVISVSKIDEEKKIDKTFNEIDTDGNGRIDFEEFKVFFFFSFQFLIFFFFFPRNIINYN